MRMQALPKRLALVACAFTATLPVTGNLRGQEDRTFDLYLCPTPKEQTSSSDSAHRLCLLQIKTGLPAALILENLDTLEKETAQKNFNAERFAQFSPIVARWYAAHPAYVDSVERVREAIKAEERHQQIATAVWILFGLTALAATLVALYRGAVLLRNRVAPTRNAVWAWHAGQLGAVWIAALLVEGLLYGWFRLSFNDHEHGWETPFFPLIFIAVLYMGILAAMLRLTWLWFGGRSTKDSGLSHKGPDS